MYYNVCKALIRMLNSCTARNMSQLTAKGQAKATGLELPHDSIYVLIIHVNTSESGELCQL